MEENDASISTLMETLKDEYTVRAEMIALMVNDHDDREITAEEYQDLAEHCSVDEIHLFDETGTIIGGSNPEYYGYNFDSGEQLVYFKPMLSDKTKSMCQDVTENTAEKKPMMYAITWAKCGRHGRAFGETNRSAEADEDARVGIEAERRIIKKSIKKLP